VPLLELKEAHEYTLPGFSVITVDVRRVRYQALLHDGTVTMSPSVRLLLAMFNLSSLVLDSVSDSWYQPRPHVGMGLEVSVFVGGCAECTGLEYTLITLSFV